MQTSPELCELSDAIRRVTEGPEARAVAALRELVAAEADAATANDRELAHALKRLEAAWEIARAVVATLDRN